MLGNDPNVALLVLLALGLWEAGRSGRGAGPAAHRVGKGGNETGRSSNSSGSSNSCGKPPPQAPQAPLARASKRSLGDTSREAGKTARVPTPTQAQAQAQATPRPPPPPGNRVRDPYGNMLGVGDTRYVPSAEGGNAGTVSQVAVLGDWDEELRPKEWWVVSQGSEGGRRRRG